MSLPKGSKPISYRDAVDAYRSNIEFNFAKLQGIKTVPKNRKQVRGVFNDAYYNYFLRKRDPMEKYKVYSPVKKLTDKIIDSMKDGHILE